VTAGGILIALIVVIIVIAFARRSSRKARRTALDLGELSVLNAAAAADPLALEGVDVDEMPMLPPAPVGPDPVAVKRAEIGALADEQPEEVADLLRGWLAESSGARR
jgi:flagellar M-ring protein FliF